MKSALNDFTAELEAIREAGTWREERIITTPQYSRIDTTAKPGVVNFCANNYLGLSTHPELIKAAKESYDKWEAVSQRKTMHFLFTACHMLCSSALI